MSLSEAARIGACIGFIALILLVGVGLVAAHEGHDHGPPAPALPTAVKPRIAVETELYQLVAIASGEQLSLYLDRYGTNEPLTDGGIAILVGDRTLPATRLTDGSFTATVAGIAAPGQHDLVFNVSHRDGDDLLAGILNIPDTAAAISAPPSDLALWRISLPRLALGGLTLLAGLGLGLAIRTRRKLAIAFAAMLCAVLLATGAAAHEGHEPSPIPNGASLSGDVPRRLPDGSIFLPKPSQRLLTIRSQIAEESNASRTVTLVGRVIADPNRSGIVQSIAGGRVSPADVGLPRLGQVVNQGDVLARVEPALPLADQSTLAEKQRDLEGAIQLARQKHERLVRIGAPSVARGTLEDAELEITNLQQRLAGLRAAKLQPEILTAPINGAVSVSRVVAGQVVGAQDVLFQIVDPSSLWVEALLFDQLDSGAIVDASAVTSGGMTMRLSYRGRGRALQAQAVQIQFAVLEPPANVAVGLPVTVIARKAEPVRGLLLPRDAVVRGAAGETIVWHQIEPERFVARQVRVEPFDGAQVLVTGGIASRDRIVVHGAETLSQVR